MRFELSGGLEDQEVVILKQQVRVRVTDYTYVRLKDFAKRKGIPMAYIVRIAISDYLSRKGGFHE